MPSRRKRGDAEKVVLLSGGNPADREGRRRFPGASKQKDVRYFDIAEEDELDEAQLAQWMKQAAALPGFLAPGR